MFGLGLVNIGCIAADTTFTPHILNPTFWLDRSRSPNSSWSYFDGSSSSSCGCFIVVKQNGFK